MRNHASFIFYSIILILFSGYITNLVFVFSNLTSEITVQVILAILGIIVFPLGVLHGIILWF